MPMWCVFGTLDGSQIKLWYTDYAEAFFKWRDITVAGGEVVIQDFPDGPQESWFE